MVVEKTMTVNTEEIKSNYDYIQRYVDLLYLRAVVGGMLAYAEQTSFQDILESNNRRSRDYEDYGVTNRSEFISKLKSLKEAYTAQEKSFM